MRGSPPRIPTTPPPCTSMTRGNGSRPTRSPCGSSALRSTGGWRKIPDVVEATQICGAATDRLVRSGDADGRSWTRWCRASSDVPIRLDGLTSVADSGRALAGDLVAREGARRRERRVTRAVRATGCERRRRTADGPDEKALCPRHRTPRRSAPVRPAPARTASDRRSCRARRPTRRAPADAPACWAPRQRAPSAGARWLRPPP